MKSSIATSISVAAAALLAGACAINQNVRPVTAGSAISQVCIKKNTEVFMSDFVKELKSQVEAKGIKASIYEGTAPAECRYRLEYTANWHWDLAMYLVYADLRVYEGELMIGEANYDARGGGFRLDKFGSTAGKLQPLVDQLFVRRS